MSKIAIDWLTPLSIAVVAAMAVPHTSFAEERDDVPAFKLTVGGHQFSESGNAVDVNLRHSSVLGTTWLGYFDSSGLDAHQFRGGWEHSFGDTIRFLPSIQAASGGFVGGSINLETGNTWFIGAGLGRTNLRPYFNLNYDPNDAWSLSGGYRAADGVSYALSYTRDNRENPDQQHFHMVYKTPINDRDRATFDVLYKRGLVNGDPINKVGVTATYDWPRFFVRLAYDPNTNFTPDNVLRVSIGSRF